MIWIGNTLYAPSQLLWDGLLVFGLTALVDAVWARYTMSITAKRPAAAAGYAAAIVLCGGVTILAYTTHPWLLVPSAAGAFAGTWITVKLSHPSV